MITIFINPFLIGACWVTFLAIISLKLCYPQFWSWPSIFLQVDSKLEICSWRYLDHFIFIINLFDHVLYIFLSKTFAVSLLLAHITVLIIFAIKKWHRYINLKYYLFVYISNSLSYVVKAAALKAKSKSATVTNDLSPDCIIELLKAFLPPYFEFIRYTFSTFLKQFNRNYICQISSLSILCVVFSYFTIFTI